MTKKKDSTPPVEGLKRGIWDRLQKFTGSNGYEGEAPQRLNIQVLKSGVAQRVAFYYPGEEGSYIENVQVTLYENGMVHIVSPGEETSTHLQNCEILWRFEAEADPGQKAGKVRLLKIESQAESKVDAQGQPVPHEKPSSQSPDLIE